MQFQYFLNWSTAVLNYFSKCCVFIFLFSRFNYIPLCVLINPVFPDMVHVGWSGKELRQVKTDRIRAQHSAEGESGGAQPTKRIVSITFHNRNLVNLTRRRRADFAITRISHRYRPEYTLDSSSTG